MVWIVLQLNIESISSTSLGNDNNAIYSKELNLILKAAKAIYFEQLLVGNDLMLLESFRQFLKQFELAKKYITVQRKILSKKINYDSKFIFMEKTKKIFFTKLRIRTNMFPQEKEIKQIEYPFPWIIK